MEKFLPPFNRPIQIYPGLWQSGFIKSEKVIKENGIDVIIDLEGGVDPWGIIDNVEFYFKWAIEDGKLPNQKGLSCVANIGYGFHCLGYNVLTHCFFGLNRSSLVNGMILARMGFKGPKIISLIEAKIGWALTNKVFRKYLEKV